MDRLNPKSRSDAYGSRINRDHSPILIYLVPWGTILIGSLASFFPIVSAVPLAPPLGLLFLLGWRLVRPGLLPVWAGFPIGLFDDLFSGQPFGNGILFFSLIMLVLEFLDVRFPWRSFYQDWLAAALAIIAYLVGSAVFSGAEVTLIAFLSLVPQTLLSILAYPVVARLIGGLDRLRLLRVRVLS